MGAKLNYLILGISLAVGVILRTVMLLFTVNADSGFIVSEHIVTAVLIMVFMLVAAALVFVSAFTQKKDFNISFMPTLSAVTNLLMAAAIFYEVFISKLLSYATPMQSLFHKGAGALAMLALIYMGVCPFIKMDYPKILSVFPIIFWITRVVTVFAEFAALATVSDTVIETIAMCLCLVSFMDNGKFECGLSVKSKKMVRALAALCGYTCLVGSLPRIICMLSVPEPFAYFANIPPYTTLAAALFVLVFALKINTEE